MFQVFDNRDKEIERLNEELRREQIASREVQTQLNEELDLTRRKLELVTEELNNFGAQLELQLTNNESRLEATIVYKNNEIAQLQGEVVKTHDMLNNLRMEYDDLSRALNESNSLVDKLKDEKSEYLAEIDRYAAQIEEADYLASNLLHITESLDENSDNTTSPGLIEKLGKLRTKFGEVISQLENLKVEQEHFFNRELMLKNEIAEKQEHLDALAQERDQLLTQLNEKSDMPKIDLDEDVWGSGSDQQIHEPVIPSVEIQLRMKIEELEEVNKNAQIKMAKLVKKCKEYKAQCENLQRQRGFGDLDSAIEDELKSQVEQLEKSLEELREEHKKTLAEKEKLLNRVDVLVAAGDRFTEMKERQDNEIRVWQMRNAELEAKVGSTDHEKCQEEIRDLRENLESLAAENEQIHQAFEEHRTKRQVSEEHETTVQQLRAQNMDLESEISRLRNDYDALRKQYEQSLMDANDQVQAMRENSEAARIELEEKSTGYQMEIGGLTEKIKLMNEEAMELYDKLSELGSTKEKLELATEQLNENSREVAHLRDQVDDFRRDKASTEQRLQAIVDDLWNVIHQNLQNSEVLNRHVDEKEGVISRLNVTIEILEEELNKRANQIRELRLLEKDCVNTSELKDQEIQVYAGKIESMQEILNEKEAIIRSREAMIEDQQMQLEKFKYDVESCNSRVEEQDELLRKIQNLGEEVHSLREELVVVRKAKNGVEAELDKVLQTNHILEMSLNAKQGHYDALSKEMTEKLKIIDSLETQIADCLRVKSDCEEAQESKQVYI